MAGIDPLPVSAEYFDAGPFDTGMGLTVSDCLKGSAITSVGTVIYTRNPDDNFSNKAYF